MKWTKIVIIVIRIIVFRASTKALPLASACLPPDRSMFLAAQVSIIIIIIISFRLLVVIKWNFVMQRQIYNLMKFDSYPRFLKSHVYKECIRLVNGHGERLVWRGLTKTMINITSNISLCSGLRWQEVVGTSWMPPAAQQWRGAGRRGAPPRGGGRSSKPSLEFFLHISSSATIDPVWSSTIAWFRLDSLKSKRRKSMSFWENWGGKVMQPRLKW